MEHHTCQQSAFPALPVSSDGFSLYILLPCRKPRPRQSTPGYPASSRQSCDKGPYRWVKVFSADTGSQLYAKLLCRIKEAQPNDYALTRTLLSSFLGGWTNAFDVRLHALTIPQAAQGWNAEVCECEGDVRIIQVDRLQANATPLTSFLRDNVVLQAFWVPFDLNQTPDPAPLSSFKAPTPGPDTVDYCSEGTWESADSSMHEVLRQCGKDVAVAMTSVSWSRSSNRSLSRLLCELDRDPVRNMKAARIVDDDWHLNVLEREKQPDKDDRISAEKGWGVFSQNAVVLSRHIHRGFRHGTLALMPLPNAGWIDRNTIRPLDERWTGQRWYKDMYLPLPDDVFRIELEDNLNWDDLTLDVIPTAKTSPSYDDYGGNDAWHRLGPRGAFLDAAGMLRILARPNIVDEDLLEWLRAFFAGDSSQANADEIEPDPQAESMERVENWRRAVGDPTVRW